MTTPTPTGWSAREVLTDPKVLVDLVAPTVLFAVAAARLPLGAAAAIALTWCGVVLAWRLVRRERLFHAMNGLGGVAVGVVVALASGQAEDFFLPGIVANGVFGVLCVVSVLARRPALAYTSAALYRWPLGWYWHPQVRPAYSETTWLWAAWYLGKAAWQAVLVAEGDVAALATVRIALGWPGLAALLVITYGYIRKRLDALGGPDVEEWRAANQPDGEPERPAA